jgi:hypothetical protein
MTPQLQPAGPTQLPLHDAMWTNQGTGAQMVNLGIMTRAWIGALQNLAAAATSGLSLSVVEYDLATGVNSLDPAALGLPANPVGLAAVILVQPTGGAGSIVWSSDFAGTVVGIDGTASTASVFVFAALGAQWVMLAYPTTGVTAPSP